MLFVISNVIRCNSSFVCLSAWHNNSHGHQSGLCSSTSPAAAVSQAGFNASFSEALAPALSANIYGSVRVLLLFCLGLYRIADFTIRPNKNKSFYYSAEYE